MAAKTGHDHWLLTESESKDLGKALEDVANRYVLWLLESHMELAALVVVTLVITVPRAMTEVRVTSLHILA